MKKQILTFGLANLLGALLSMLGALWVANMVGPDLMGVYSFLQLIATYAPLLALGVFNGLNRELPFSIGKGNQEEAGRLAAIALFVCNFICLVAAICMLFAAFFSWTVGDTILLFGLAVYALVIPLTFYRIYLEVTFRTSHDFSWLSLVKIITAIASILFIPLLYIDSWGGMLLRAVLMALLGVALLWIKRPFRVAPFWDVKIFQRLFVIGLPIFIVGNLYVFFTNLDRLIITYKFDVATLGKYTPALLILQGMSILPSSVAQVIYPRAAEHYGREGTINKLIPILFMPLPIMLVIQLPFVSLGWIYMDELVTHFMPRFGGGIEAARWSLLVGLAISMTTPAIVFNVARQQRMYAAVMLLSILAAVVAWALKLGGGGLVGVSVAMLYGSVCFATLSALVAWYLCKKDTCE